jgi:hypothetical protein
MRSNVARAFKAGRHRSHLRARNDWETVLPMLVEISIERGNPGARTRPLIGAEVIATTTGASSSPIPMRSWRTTTTIGFTSIGFVTPAEKHHPGTRALCVTSSGLARARGGW